MNNSNAVKRQAFSFYTSYDEVISDLDDKQLALFVRALLDIQFFRKHLDDICFKDIILSITWKASKHSIKKQIEGYCNANKIDYESLFIRGNSTPKASYKDAPEASYTGTPSQEEEQEEEEGQGQEPKHKQKSFFTLSRITSFDNLTDDYISKLKEKIEKHNEDLFNKRQSVNSPLKDVLGYEEFSNKFLASGKKQKDFWMTFNQYKKYVYDNEIKRKNIGC